MSWVAVGVGGVSLATSVVKGINAGKADKRATAEGNNLRRPFEKIPDEYYQNKNIEAAQATSGLSIDEKGELKDERQEAFGSSVDALNRTGSVSPNDYSHIVGLFNDSLKSQAALDSSRHAQNIDYFTNINKELAGQKTEQWGVNEYQPFESKLKEIQDRKIAAMTNKNNAINEGIGSLAALSTSINSAIKPNTDVSDNSTSAGFNAYGPGGNPNDVDLAAGVSDTPVSVQGDGNLKQLNLDINQ